MGLQLNCVRAFQASFVLSVTTSNGIAVDGDHQLVYYTEEFYDRISVMSTTGEQRTHLITTNLQVPRAIVLDLVARWVLS